MKIPVNWPLISNPLNWGIALTMLAIFGLMAHEIGKYVQVITPNGDEGNM